MIEVGAVVFMVLMTGVVAFTLVRATQLVSHRLYFSTFDLLQQHELPPLGIVVRGSIPILLGALWGILWPPQAIVIATAGSFLGALLTVWAAIAHPYLLPEAIANRRTSVYTVFAVYALSYAALGMAGVFVSYIAVQVLPSTWLGQGIVLYLTCTLLGGVGGYWVSTQRLKAEVEAMMAAQLKEFEDRMKKAVQGK